MEMDSPSTQRKPLYIPTKEEFSAGVQAYERNEGRGRVYFTALERLAQGWGQVDAMTEAIGLLLKSWHRAFYRFGMFDPAALKQCIEKNLDVLTLIRSRSINSLSREDERLIARLFSEFTTALRGPRAESQVAPAKSLHLLAPDLLPLWDNPIALGCGWWLMWPHEYVSFCWQIKDLAAAVIPYLMSPDNRTVLKRIDEFNYSAYTKGWISIRGTLG
jgi:hypothetical protein